MGLFADGLLALHIRLKMFQVHRGVACIACPLWGFVLSLRLWLWLVRGHRGVADRSSVVDRHQIAHLCCVAETNLATVLANAMSLQILFCLLFLLCTKCLLGWSVPSMRIMF